MLSMVLRTLHTTYHSIRVGHSPDFRHSPLAESAITPPPPQFCRPIPSKHEILTQCIFIVGPQSVMLAEH